MLRKPVDWMVRMLMILKDLKKRKQRIKGDRG